MIHIITVMMRIVTLWFFNIAMENGTFIDGLPGFTYIENGDFPRQTIK